MLIKPEGMKKQRRDKDGVPDTKKLVRTGERSFVVEAEGGNRFEGEITNPSAVRFKESGRITLTNIGLCLKNCINKGKLCDKCYRFSNLQEPEACPC